MHLPSITSFLSLSLYGLLVASATTGATYHAPQVAITDDGSRNITTKLFLELEELARLVDISYCVGNSGVWKPFRCASRCAEFEGVELVDTWNTGPLLSDSCGYIALDHTGQRTIVAFRGTYSIANTIVDLTTVPQEYVPYPGDPDSPSNPGGGTDAPRSQLPSWRDWLPHLGRGHAQATRGKKEATQQVLDDNKQHKCTNCTVHLGFLRSWENTRSTVLPHILTSHTTHPSYTLHLVGHSLGGAVAALAGLELQIKGLSPVVTTFGEPRLGNSGLAEYLDAVFDLDSEADGEGEGEGKRYRRVTHRDDPVPLLPLTEWGYRPHAGEIYIAKKHLSPEVGDLRFCVGNQDQSCSAGAKPQSQALFNEGVVEDMVTAGKGEEELEEVGAENWGIPARLKVWEMFFAHRDYFWRLGLCVPGGDPRGWLGKPYEDVGERRVEEL